MHTVRAAAAARATLLLRSVLSVRSLRRRPAATLGDTTKRVEYDQAQERKTTINNYNSSTWNSDLFGGSARTRSSAAAAAAPRQRKCLGCAYTNEPGVQTCARCASRMCNPCPACGKVMDSGYACYGCGYQEPKSSGYPSYNYGADARGRGYGPAPPRDRPPAAAAPPRQPPAPPSQ